MWGRQNIDLLYNLATHWVMVNLPTVVQYELLGFIITNL